MGERARPRVVTVGESMAMLRSDGVGLLATTPAVSLAVGGAESNVAIGAQRLGIPALWISALGDDPFGDLVESRLCSAVSVLVARDPERRTGFAVREQRTADRARLSYYRSGSAAAELTLETLPAGAVAAVEQAEVLHVSGINLAVGAPLRATTLALVRIARAAGTLVSFDVNHRTSLWGSDEAREAFREILPLVDVCFAGDDEAALVVGADAEHAGVPDAVLPIPAHCDSAEPGSVDHAESLARGLAALGPRHVVLKRGALGALALDDGVIETQPAYRVSVVDTVGAGDSFVAGYLSAFLEGASIAERLDRGMRCGAITCGSAGDWEGAPSRAELTSLIGDGDPVIR